MANRYFVGGSGNWNDTAHWSTTSGGSSGASAPSSNDDVFLDSNSSGTLTVNVESYALSITCTGFTGTLTLSAKLHTYGSVTLVSGMTFTPSTNEWQLNRGGTFDFGGKSLYDLRVGDSGWGASTHTFSGNNVTVTNKLTFQGQNGSIDTIDGMTIYCNKDFEVTASGAFKGTTNIVLNGSSGSQNITGDASGFLGLNLEIASTGGTVYFIGTLTFCNGKTLLYTSGTVDCSTNSHTLWFNGQNGATATYSGSSVNWYNISILGYGSFDLTLSSDITATGTTTFTGNNGAAISILGGSYKFHAQGNITSSISAPINGTATLQIDGGSNQTWTGNDTTNTYNIAIVINKSGGTLTLAGTIAYGTNSITYTAGTVSAGTSLLKIVSACTLNTNGMSWYDVTFGNGLTITLSSNMTVTRNVILINSVTTSTFSGSGSIRTMYVGGNVTAASGRATGSSSTSHVNIELNGTGDQTYTGNTSYINVPGKLIFNKASGTAIMSTGIIPYNGITHTLGTVDFTTNSVGLYWKDLTLNSTITSNGSITFYKFFLGANKVVTFADTFTLADDLDIGHEGVSTSTMTGSIMLSGDFVNTGGNQVLGVFNIEFTGSGTQTWSSANTTYIISTGTMTVNKSGGSLTVSGAVRWDGHFTYTAGTVTTTSSTVRFVGSKNINSGAIVWATFETFSGGTITLTGALNTGILNINSSTTLSCGSQTITVTGNVTKSGTFTASTSTFVCNGTTTFAGAMTFNNLTINAAKTVHLTPSQNFIVNGAFSAVGSSGNVIVLDSTSGGSYATLTLNGTISASYVDATDIDSSAGSSVYDPNGTLSHTLNWTNILTSFISVNDTVTLTENIARTLINNINVNDAITITEDVKVSKVLFISVNDSITLTENTVINNIVCPSVYDSITVTEAVTNNLVLLISVNDTITVAENVTVSNLTLPVNVNDTITLTENVVVNKLCHINVNDAITVTESVAVSNLTLAISVNDSITIAENVNVTEVYTISVNDTVTIAELVTISNALLYLSVNDAITLSEFSNVAIVYQISVSDSITVSENIVSATTISGISINDTITVTESLNKNLVFCVSVDDTITVAENFTVSIVSFITGLSIDVNDSVNVSEDVELNLLCFIFVNDAINITESIILDNSFLQTSVNDSISLTENIKIEETNFINCNDTVNISESTNLQNILPGISVSDNITVTESISKDFYSFINVNDTITASENVIVSNNLAGISVVDTVTVNEYINLVMLCFISVSEAITLTEDIKLLNILLLAVNDSITLAENISINNLIAGISITDNISVAEFNILANTLAGISVNDSITLSESIIISINVDLNISLSDLVTIQEDLLTKLSIEISAVDDITVSEVLTIDKKHLIVITVKLKSKIEPVQSFSSSIEEIVKIKSPIKSEHKFSSKLLKR